MQWYYAINDTRYGPVSTAQLADFAQSGPVAPATLVWREGMAEWQPFEQVRAEVMPPTPPPLVPVPEGCERCIECAQPFPREELAQVGQAWVCAGCKPAFLHKVTSGLPTGGSVWRRKRELVVARDAVLPDRCVKCNRPVHGERMKRKLSWHHPAVYLALLFNLIVYVVLALCLRKQMTVHVGVCPEHRARRRWVIAGAWSLVLLGFGSFIVAGAWDYQGMIWVGIALLFAGGAWGLWKGRVFYARKIDTQHAFVRGACTAYLAELPEWTGG